MGDGTWYQLIEKVMLMNDDSWDNTVQLTWAWPPSGHDDYDTVDKYTSYDFFVTKGQDIPDCRALNRVFDSGFGDNCGYPFYLWTKQYVYFPVTYDGNESVASAPRKPIRWVRGHVGGGA